MLGCFNSSIEGNNNEQANYLSFLLLQSTRSCTQTKGRKIAKFLFVCGEKVLGSQVFSEKYLRLCRSAYYNWPSYKACSTCIGPTPF